MVYTRWECGIFSRGGQYVLNLRRLNEKKEDKVGTVRQNVKRCPVFSSRKGRKFLVFGPQKAFTDSWFFSFAPFPHPMHKEGDRCLPLYIRYIRTFGTVKKMLCALCVLCGSVVISYISLIVTFLSTIQASPVILQPAQSYCSRPQSCCNCTQSYCNRPLSRCNDPQSIFSHSQSICNGTESI